MCSLMLSVQAAPTSVSLVQGAYCDKFPPVHEKYECELNPLHMNWLLVAARAQMRWVVDR